MSENRYLVEVRSGLKTPFWSWQKKLLTETADKILKNAALNVPRTPEEVVIREQDFGRARALLDLLDQIPNTIEMEIQETKQNEQKNAQETN